MPYPTMISKQFVTLLTVVTVVAALAAVVPAAAQQEGSASSANRARRDTGAIQRDSAAGTLVGDDEVLIDARPELVSRTRVSFDSARALSLSRLPGGRVTAATLADKHDRLFWTLDVRRADDHGVDRIWIDANTATVFRTQYHSRR